MRGYYSLIQYCPDSSRAEAANVGVILLCPEAHFIECKVSSGNDRVRKFFSVHGESLARLDQMKEAFEERIQLDRGRLWKLEDFEQFIATRGNKLQITAPRNMKVLEPAEDLVRLYKEMVGGRAKGEAVKSSGRGRSLKPQLRNLFNRPELKERVRENVEVKPKYVSAFKADYAFYNGKDSFVEAQVIHVDREQTLKEAGLLAMRGIQLAKHGLGDREAELIVPLPNFDDRFAETTREVAALFEDSKVRTIFESHLEDLAEEIREHADVL